MREEHVDATDESLRALVDAAADGIVVVDELGIICYVNKAAQSLLDRPLDELVGHFFGYPLGGGDVTEIGLFRGGEPLTVEMRVTSLQWEGQPAHLAMLRDVTERKHAQQELQQAVDLRDDVIALVAHDLRSPLAAILSAARLLETAWDEPDEELSPRELVEGIIEQASHMNELVDGLMTLSRYEAGELEVQVAPVEVAEVIEQALREAGNDRSGVVDEVEVADGLRVAADEHHLRRILVNFVSNAVKYGEPPVQVVARPAGDTVEVMVTDEGDGVPKQFVDELFRRFRRSSSARAQAGGSGLGLAVASRLAAASNGEVWYRPNEPKGACFGVRLPSA